MEIFQVVTMFNIISFSLDKFDTKAFGYENLYEFDKIKNGIVTVKNASETGNYKNKKILILLESYDFDANTEGAIKLIGEKKKACFLIDFSRIINSYGVNRAILLSKIRTFLKLCVKYNVFYAFADFAKDEYEIRSSQELAHIALLLGLNIGQAKFALKMLKHYL